MTKRLLCSAVAAVVLAACGSDNPASSNASLCDKATSLAPGIQAKLSQCTTLSGAFNVPTGTSCATELANCTQADRDILNRSLDCVNGLPTCTTATIADFGTRASACVPTGLSSACDTAVNGP
jgi:hypothetical protein